MVGLSQTTGYAVAALTYLGRYPDRRVLGREIAEGADVPAPYLSKLLHAMVGAGLVNSKRGYRGGFRLERDPDQISLLDIVKAVEGEKGVDVCLLGRSECSDDRACPAHQFWAVERGRIERKLARISIAETSAFEQRRERAGGGRGSARGPRRQPTKTKTKTGR